MIKIFINGLSGLDGLKIKTENIKETCGTALERSGDLLCSVAKELAPVKTGKLRDSILMEKADIDNVSVGSSLPYAVFVEIGTERSTAQSFMQKSALLCTEQIKDIFIEEFTT